MLIRCLQNFANDIEDIESVLGTPTAEDAYNLVDKVLDRARILNHFVNIFMVGDILANNLKPKSIDPLVPEASASP